VNESAGNILVVDDHIQISDTLRRLLILSGYDAVSRHHGRDALSYMSGSRPACVILDQMMPDMTGLEVLRTMRQIPELAAVPVIFFSAVDSQPIHDEALRLGANAWLLKGTSWPQILKVVQDVTLPTHKPPPDGFPGAFH
jgi:CheY-like chemotaxis protein